MWDGSSSEEEYDMDEEEDIALIIWMEKNKMPKYGGFVVGREVIPRLRKDRHNRLMRN